MKVKSKGIEKIIVKILLPAIVFIVSILMIGYFILWGYISKFNEKESVDNYKEKIFYNLTEEQAKIIWFTLTNNKEYEFKWYPFIIDSFFKSNDLTSYTVHYLIDKNGKHNVWPFVSYATSRYINRRIKNPRSKLRGIEDFSFKSLRMWGNKSPTPPVFRSKLRGIKP